MRSGDLSRLVSGAGRLAVALGEHVMAKLRRPQRRPLFPRRCHWCDRQVRYDAAADALGHDLPACETWSVMVMGRLSPLDVAETSPAPEPAGPRATPPDAGGDTGQGMAPCACGGADVFCTCKATR